jgi:hypothetical protein
VIVAQGGAFAGWSLYVKDGKPKYCHNLFGVQRFYVKGDTEIPSGTHQVRMEFNYDGGGLGKGGTVSLYIDCTKTGEGRSPRRQRLYRQHRMGADRHRRRSRRRRSSYRAGGAAQICDGKAMSRSIGQV